MSSEKNSAIKDWAPDDQPREKLMKKGISALSNAELLTILIGTGTRDASALDLSKRLLEKANNNLQNLGKLGLSDLSKIKGIGPAKSVSILAAFELGRRRQNEEVVQRGKIISSKDAYDFFWPLIGDLQHEEFWVVFLNRANTITGYEQISQGGISGTVIDTRRIFMKAIENSASNVIAAHNHPSGNKQPSDADKRITLKIKQGAELFEMKLLDHLIIADKNYFSFADEGIL